MVSSVIFRSATSRQALDHQENLALDAMALWVRTAFWMSGLGCLEGRPGISSVGWWQGVGGVHPHLSSDPNTGVVVCSE